MCPWVFGRHPGHREHGETSVGYSITIAVSRCRSGSFRLGRAFNETAWYWIFSKSQKRSCHPPGLFARSAASGTLGPFQDLRRGDGHKWLVPGTAVRCT